jgi:hypothetical protein
VPLIDLKFLNEVAVGNAGTSNRRHWGGAAGFASDLREKPRDGVKSLTRLGFFKKCRGRAAG